MARNARFASPRIEICQWCVTFLIDHPVNPTMIHRRIEEILDSYLSRQPRFRSPSYYEVESAVKLQLKYPSFSNGLLMSLFDRERKRNIVRAVETKTLEIISENNKRIEAQKANEKQFLYDQIMNTRLGPRVISYFNTRTGAEGYSDLVPPKLVKYYNAFRFGLIAGEDKVLRPNDDEWVTLRRSILQQDGFMCRVCGACEGERHVHHIIPLSKYGTNEPNNLITLCYKCHVKQHPDFTISKRMGRIGA